MMRKKTESIPSPPMPPADTSHSEQLIISVDPITAQAMRDFSQGVRALQNLTVNAGFPEMIARIVDALNQVRQGYESQ